LKIIVQRVQSAKLVINSENISEIGRGLLIYVGFAKVDTKDVVNAYIHKLCQLRIFADENDKLNLSVIDLNFELLVVPNFTLYADIKKGNRPSFCSAMKYTQAKELFEYMKSELLLLYDKIRFGVFGADMKINSICDGPINIIIESE